MNAHLTLQEFQVAMHKIVQNPPWKRTYAGGDVLDLIYEKVNHVKFEQFKIICERLLGSSRSAPIVPDFERAVAEMGFRKYAPQQQTYTSSSAGQENVVYHLEGDTWADSNYIFIKGARPGFIIKRDSPDHPLVQLDRAEGSRFRTEAESAIKTKKYTDYLKAKAPAPARVSNFNTMNFDQFKEAK